MRRVSIIHIDETDSTNNWLRRYTATTADGTENGDVAVVADFQQAGRGCGSNSWESEWGKNLTFSLLTHPENLPANQQFRITEAVSVAICETLEHSISNKVMIKWPNDIYVGDRKICGILIENRLQGNTIKDCIIGIGLNVNQRQFVSDAPNPVSLWQLTHGDTDRDRLLLRLLKNMERAWQRPTIGDDYRQRLYRLGEPHRYKDSTGLFTATITGVASDGRLLLTDEDGRQRDYAFKEIQYIIQK